MVSKRFYTRYFVQETYHIRALRVFLGSGVGHQMSLFRILRLLRLARLIRLFRLLKELWLLLKGMLVHRGENSRKHEYIETS